MSETADTGASQRLPFRQGVLLFLAFVFLFAAANRAAIHNWFSDDDLDNLWMTRDQAPYAVIASGFLSPKLAEFNFRPTGHVVYKFFSERFGLSFKPWIAFLFSVHFFNSWLVWLLVRRLGAPPPAAALGSFVFAFHMACFFAWWQPMYIFDVLCCTFLLLSLLAYLRGWLIPSLLCFWTAYKAKELAVALPAVLLLYEFTLGERRWKRILPYAVVSASFTLQGILAKIATDNDYTLRYSPAAIWKTFSFYSSRIFLIPFAGAALIPLAALVKDRTVRFGILSIALLMGPLWFLPGRLFSVYLYVPLIGLAIAVSALARPLRWRFILPLLAAWTVFHYAELRNARRKALTDGPENRAYVEAVAQFLRANPDIWSFVYDNTPPALNPWGVEAAFKYHRDWTRLRLASLNSDAGKRMLSEPSMAVVAWDGRRRKLLTSIRREGQPGESYLEMSASAPAWNFLEGWYSLENGFRWTQPVAAIVLHRPPSANRFSLTVNLGEAQFKAQGGVEVELLIDGKSLGVREFRQPGWHEQSWPLPPAPPGNVRVELRTLRPLTVPSDSRVLGAAVVALGFVERQ
jgi:hypothetical protein